jgi:MoxR-like ATPase
MDKNWWIFEGTNKIEKSKLEKRENKKPLWRNKEESQHNAKSYKGLTDEVKNAINAAIYLRRPLLVTGKPGVGKSTLAKAIAHNLGLGDILSWHVTSRSVLTTP